MVDNSQVVLEQLMTFFFARMESNLHSTGNQKGRGLS